jgi:hypothetical protein
LIYEALKKAMRYLKWYSWHRTYIMEFAKPPCPASGSWSVRQDTVV